MTRARDLANIADGTFTATDLNLSGTLDVSGDATFDTNTLFVDVSANAVGIGTTSPYSPLTIDTANGILNIANGNTSGGTKIQAWGTTPTNGYLAIEGYDKEYMRIDSSGRLLVGTSTPVGTEQVLIASSSAGSQPQQLNIKDTNASANGNYFLIVRKSDDTYLGGLRRSGTDTAMAVDGTLHLAFQISGTEVGRFDGNGNLGIGTTVPADYGANLAVANTSGTSKITIAASTSGVSALAFADGTTPASARAAGFIHLDHSSNAMQFGIADSERMRINSSGNLLVGTTSAPYAGMKISTGNTSSAEAGLQVQTSTSGVGYVLFGDGTAGSAYVGQLFYNHGQDVMGFATGGLERARIDSSGRLLVGATAADGIGGAPGDINNAEIGKGYINLNRDDTATVRQIQFGKNGVVAGYIETASSTTSYVTSSDARLKENIADSEDAGAKVDAIQVRQFDWKADGSHQDYGMIAQELT
jgi:hypothetical protein